MKLRIEYPAAALLAAYLFWDRSGTALWVLLGAAVHELGHIAAIRACGQKISAFELRPFAAKIRKERGSPLREMLISAAGPLAGLLLAALLTALGQRRGAAASLALTVFNLLPVYPLDGWRLLDLTLTRFASPQAVRKTETAAAVFTAAAVLGVLVRQLILG